MVRSIADASLFRERGDLTIPALEQALALGRSAVLREVVIDQLDLRDFGRVRRDWRVDVRWELILVALRRQRLCFGRKRPVDEFLGDIEVARTFHDGERPDFVAGSFAR